MHDEAEVVTLVTVGGCRHRRCGVIWWLLPVLWPIWLLIGLSLAGLLGVLLLSPASSWIQDNFWRNRLHARRQRRRLAAESGGADRAMTGRILVGGTKLLGGGIALVGLGLLAYVIADGGYAGPNCPDVLTLHRKPPDGSPLPTWKDDHNAAHRRARVRVEHAVADRKVWKILRDCRRGGTGVAYAAQGIALLRNIALTA